MAIKFTNNATTTLSSGINTTATSIGVTDGSVFPTLGTGDITYVTFDDDTNTEVVKVTARSGNTLTVVRAQDGTSARSFSSGNKAELRITAALMNEVISDSEATATSLSIALG